MPANVILDFVPPDVPGFTKLLIYESATQAGAPGTLIETVTDIGEYPDYITRYTTTQAASGTGWFSVQFEDEQGGRTTVSDSVQGGTFTAISKLIQRVLSRDSTLDENVVLQEAEAVLATIMNVDDPYTVDVATITYPQWVGMTYLVLARSYIGELVSGGESESYTAGLVSQKSASADAEKRLKLIKELIDFANIELGLNYSIVMLLEDIDPTGLGSITSVTYDQSRLLLEID